MADSSGARLDETTEAGEYHALSPLAIGSLALGLFSILALVHPLLWIVPALGISFAVLALRAIRQSGGELTGRKVALTGLALSTVFGSAGMTQQWYSRHIFAEAARPIADAWFEFLQKGEPQKAHQLTLPVAQRRVLNDLLWDHYSSSKESRKELESFVATDVPRLVLESGEKCQVRFYEVRGVTISGDNDIAVLTYAVTFPEGTRKKTFFVDVTVERRVTSSGAVNWRIVSNAGGGRPTSMPL